MHSPTKMPQNGGTTALLLVLCLAFPGPVLAEDPHGWLLGVGISSGSFSVVADGENRWSGQFQDGSMQAIEGGYLTPKLKLFGPIGLDMLFRTTWTSFESQSISEPSGQADSRETTNVPLSSDLSITAQEAIARLHLNFAREGAGGFRVGFAGGWIRSDIEGDVYLTHASNRSDSCASAVET